MKAKKKEVKAKVSKKRKPLTDKPVPRKSRGWREVKKSLLDEAVSDAVAEERKEAGLPPASGIIVMSFSGVSPPTQDEDLDTRAEGVSAETLAEGAEERLEAGAESAQAAAPDKTASDGFGVASVSLGDSPRNSLGDDVMQALRERLANRAASVTVDPPGTLRARNIKLPTRYRIGDKVFVAQGDGNFAAGIVTGVYIHENAGGIKAQYEVSHVRSAGVYDSHVVSDRGGERAFSFPTEEAIYTKIARDSEDADAALAARRSGHWTP